MFEDYQICPYTGLRSFTEEESLYFKGREEHIEQATEQLQRNKFLMLTGASGDGKSSLVYAGIVPNARAGFLKSKYTQWGVADFRPERTPFKNLCRAVAKQLNITNPQTVEAELQHGFSALVDLYKNSSFFVDVDSVAWQQASEAQRAEFKRSASNLIIIVDQFEEFFTNPENYHHGVPSRDSNLVLNVLLETARIALEEDLPIYIVFTMRSDYIGQCAAFRSLPEYIGFSQFFVPRLNRSQLQQVIEEPASLSGNKISRRLTERLIHDIAEGIDQLPILQHALNQIWHAAAQGKDEMDLIHYAMVGGMPSSELPDDQVGTFARWFDNQSDKIKLFYREPNLQNVLDTHANKLYESAAGHYRSKTGKVLSDETAKAIIKTTFSCLTKIDQSRAVRNRMTLKEIYNILNRRDVDVETIGGVLNIFREPGNTFIRPFITDDTESVNLNEDAVLDITHESLIRNWEYLEQWANEEFDNYAVSLDFEKQLNRWVTSNKASGFLLSIGPLTYFENWYTKVNPNTWWIARYLPEDIDQNKKLEKASVVVNHTREFLKQSARKHLITRTIVRYGPRRIGTVLAIIALFMMSSFVVRRYYEQQNSFVLDQVKEQSLELANSSKVDTYLKGMLLAELLRAGKTTVPEIINRSPDSLAKINVINRLAAVLIVQGRNEPKEEIKESLFSVDSLLNQYPIEKSNLKNINALLKEMNFLRATLELACMYDPSDVIKDFRSRNAKRSATLVKHVLKIQPEGFKDVGSLNAAMENAVNYQGFTREELQGLLNTLSPFENSNRSEWVDAKYAKDNHDVRGFFEYGFKFNGLFQQLAYLYAARGETAKVLQCTDSLLKYNQNYYQNDYGSMIDNGSNIAVVYYQNKQAESFEAFVSGYCQRKKITETEFYQRLIGRLWFAENAAPNLDEGATTLSNLNTQDGSNEMTNFFFAHFRKSIEKNISNADERNYYLALTWKDEALLLALRTKLNNQKPNNEKLVTMFDKAVEHYNMVDRKFLDQEVLAAKFSDNDATSVPLKFIFLYPDYRTTFNPREPRSFYFYYSSEVFIKYLLDKDLVNKLYLDVDLMSFSSWLESYFANMTDPAFQSRQEADTSVLIDLEKKLTQRNASLPHINFLYFTLGNEAFKSGNASMASYYYDKIEIDKIANLLRYPNADANREVFYTVASSVTGLIGIDRFDDAYAIIKLFKNPINRSTLYAFAATGLLRKKNDSPIVQQLIDSAQIELTRIENLSTDQPNRILIAYALAMQDPFKNTPAAYKTIKNISNKYWPALRITRSYAFHGDLYQAKQHIIENISDEDQTEFLWNILYGYQDGLGGESNSWEEYEQNYFWVSTRIIAYINEDN